MNRRAFLAGILVTVAEATALARSRLDVIHEPARLRRDHECMGWWLDSDDYHVAVANRDIHGGFYTDQELFDRLHAVWVECTRTRDQPDFIYCDKHVLAAIHEIAADEGVYL